MTQELRVGRRAGGDHPSRQGALSAGITKLELARHFERVAPVMLPYVRDRPLALQVFHDVWLSRAGEPRPPDRLILDFDPSGGSFTDVRAASGHATALGGARGPHAEAGPLDRG